MPGSFCWHLWQLVIGNANCNAVCSLGYVNLSHGLQQMALLYLESKLQRRGPAGAGALVEQRGLFLNHLTLLGHIPFLKPLRKLLLHFQRPYLANFGLPLILMCILIKNRSEQ